MLDDGTAEFDMENVLESLEGRRSDTDSSQRSSCERQLESTNRAESAAVPKSAEVT